MTEKRYGFEMDSNCYMCICDTIDKKLYTDKKQVVDLLNELNDKCEFLEIENESLEDGATKYAELYHQSLKENERLKQRVEQLENNIEKYIGAKYKKFVDGEIGGWSIGTTNDNDMNSLIEDEIDKKIAVLTDAKIKSFQNGDEELLRKIKFGIQILRELKEVILND